MDESRQGLMLYGFHETPPLDIEINWSKMHIQNCEYLNISYSLKSQCSVPLLLITAQGRQSFLEWLDDLSYPNSTLSWNIIQGNGIIRQEIPMSNMYYYIVVANLNSENIEVQLNLTVRDFHYDIANAYCKCSLSHHLCRLNSEVVSPKAKCCCTDVSCNITGALTAVILSVFKILDMFSTTRAHETNGIESERRLLLSRKEDDLLSWGSSYDSLSHDEEDFDEWLAVASLSGKPTNGEETYQDLRCLCAICFDAPRDCFFLPCGHCAVCFTSGMRFMEEAGTCAICRRTMKKVRRIFAV